MSQKPLITAQGLSVHYPLRGGLIGPKPFVRAVENVTIEIAPGSFFGLVGRKRVWQNNTGPRDAQGGTDQPGRCAF